MALTHSPWRRVANLGVGDRDDGEGFSSVGFAQELVQRVPDGLAGVLCEEDQSGQFNDHQWCHMTTYTTINDNKWSIHEHRW
jgi:hypothetical protein